MLFSGVLLLLFYNGFTDRKDLSIFYSRIAIIILIYCTILSFNCFFPTYLEGGLALYNGLFTVTAITQTFHSFIFIISFVILLLTSFYPRKISINNISANNNNKVRNWVMNKMSEQYAVIEYALILLFIIIGSSFILSCEDFISLFLSIELQSYGLYILCVIYRNSEPSTNSGLIYFLLGGLSSCFILLSIVFIYINTGTFHLDGFYLLTNLWSNSESTNIFYNLDYLTLSLTILSTGLLFKISAAPFHFWSPDVYDGIPTIVTTFVGIIAKISILIFMLDLVNFTSESLKTTTNWIVCILMSSMLSLLVGTILGLSQTRIKRLLAYSTISHIGFILLALGVNSIESNKAFIFYLLQYTITNLNSFVIIISIGFSIYIYISNNYETNKLKDLNNSPIQLISQIQGLFYKYSFLAVSLAIVMLSFIGLPPILGFFAKQMVLSSALDDGIVFLVLVAVITSVIGAVYYLNLIKTMFFEQNSNKNIGISLDIITSDGINFIISLITLITLFYIYIPNELLNLSNILTIVTYTDNTISL